MSTTTPPPSQGLLSLPPELLLQVLSYDLLMPFRIDSTMHSKLSLNTLNILFVNKALRSLALQVYYSENTFSLWPTRDIFAYPHPGVGHLVRSLMINLPLSHVSRRFTGSFVMRPRYWEVSVEGLPRVFEPRTLTGQEGAVNGDAGPEMPSSPTRWQTYYPLLKVVQFSFREGRCLNEKGKENFRKLPNEACIRLSPVEVTVTCKSRWDCEKTGCQEHCFGLIKRSLKSIVTLREDEG